MKRMASFALVLVALIWSTAVITPLFAQTAAEEDVYVVQPGDNLYQLSGIYLNDPEKWREVLKENSFLSEPGRIREKADGQIIVIIRPREELRGLQQFGIAPNAVGADEIAPETGAKTVELKVVEASTVPGWLNWLTWLLLAIVVAAAAWAIWAYRTGRLVSISEEREREMRRDPVTSGPPIVAGGVRSNETERLSRAMQAAAVTEYLRLNPGVDRASVRVDRIGPVEEGMISGSGMIGYADRARPRTIDPPQPGYRARFRFQDGREDNLMSLQGCMNPCYYGEGMSGFTFERGRQVLPTPEPARPAPTPAPHPAFAVARIREDAQAHAENTIAIGDEVMRFPLGYHLTVDRTTNDINLESNSVQMTLKARPAVEATASTPATSTGTDN